MNETKAEIEGAAIAGRAEERAAAREHYCLFDTAIGPCGVAWSEDGLTRLQLPESDRIATEKRLKARTRSAGAQEPPPTIQQVITDLVKYLTGGKVDFSSVALDLTRVSRSHRRFYEAARSVGWGQQTSYGELARQAGCPGEARAVGHALSRNPIPIIIPCHRILAAGNKVGGFSAYGGTLLKKRLLWLEGVIRQLELAV
jgi:methylated-DNA-[protein]-cysteine S-methyltransferase